MEKIKQTIDIKFAVTIMLLVVSITSNYYAFKGAIEINKKEIEEIKIARVEAWKKYDIEKKEQQEKQEKQFKEILTKLECLAVIKRELGIN